MTLMGEPGPGKPRGTRTSLFAFRKSQLCSSHSLLYTLVKIRLIFPSYTISAFSLCHSFFFFQSPSFFFALILASTMVHLGPSCPHNIFAHSAYTVWFFWFKFPKRRIWLSNWLSLYFCARWRWKLLAGLYMDPGLVTCMCAWGGAKRQGHVTQHSHLAAGAVWGSSPQKVLWSRTGIVEWSNNTKSGYPTKREDTWEKMKAWDTWVKKPFWTF